MTGYVLPLLFTALAGMLTYFFCVRPMRRGHGCHMSPQSHAHAHTAPADARTPDATDAEIRRLREEVQFLHHELDLRSAAAEPTMKERLRKGEPR
ncbi:MAG TPA: hypothetical protein VJ739_01705 [Gemmataceae bacterium]|nr:hypothetical protein [Gemmataceae bacterium]